MAWIQGVSRLFEAFEVVFEPLEPLHMPFGPGFWPFELDFPAATSPKALSARRHGQESVRSHGREGEHPNAQRPGALRGTPAAGPARNARRAGRRREERWLTKPWALAHRKQAFNGL